VAGFPAIVKPKHFAHAACSSGGTSSSIVLFRPICQISVPRSIKASPLAAAGWQVEMFGAQPA